MARDDHLEKKGRWSFKSLFKPGLRHRSFRHPRGQHRQHEVLPPLPEHGPSSLQPLPAGNGAPPTPPAASPGAEQQASNGADASPARSSGAAAPHLPAGCSLIVQVLGARRLRAADSNGLSDPYCVVKVGEHKASSKTELKTLEPRWNETMCFGAEDVADAVEGGRPHVCLRVFDWDLVSADDFLGQCELPFDSLEAQGGGAPPRWLPLYGFARSGKQVEAGEVQVAAWFQAGGGQGEAGGDAPSTLCCQPGVRKQVPQVVHSSRGVLYEEPLVACLAITLDSLEGVPSRGGAAPPGASRPREASTDSLGSLGSPQASWGGGGAGPGRVAAPRFLGRLFQRRPRQGDGTAAASASSLYSAGSTASEAMLAGEDSGDEYDGLDFYSRGLAELQAGPQDSLGGEEEPSAAHTPVRARASSDAGLDALARPSALGADGEGAEADSSPPPGASSSGSRLYVRLVLGRQKQTSWIKRQRGGSVLAWHQTFVFAAPLPLRDRQLRLELYRTASSTQRGRLVALAQVWLHDLVPPGLARNPKASRHAAVELQSALRGQPGGCAHLRCTLVDTDARRAMYGGVFLEEEEEEEAAPPRMDRLESWTAELSSRELRKKALLSEQSFSAWEESRPHRAKQRARGYRDTAIELAQLGWQRLSAFLSSSDQEAHLPIGAPGQSDGPGAQPPPLPQAPQPAGTLQLTLHSITLPAPSTAECFMVLKCGPHWGRSKALPMAGGSSVECGWQLSLPVLDPAAVLTLVLFQHSRGMRATERLRHGFLHSSGTTTAVGKLRVRLSCLRPNTLLTADLALLGERSKGGHEAAAVRLSLQACYPSARALLKGYAAPPLPAAAYEHGLSGQEHQGVMSRECRRIVLRWLESANPSITGPEALLVLDAEREVFAMSRARVNVRRIKMALVGLRRVHRKFDAIKTWQDPRQSVAAMVAICFLCFNPSRALPLLLGWVVVATLSAQPDYESSVPRMEQDPPDIQPENESLEAASANPLAALRARLERLQRMGLLVQGALDEVACAMERAEALLSWQDPCTTLGVVGVLAALALLVFALGLPAVLAFGLCFVIRPPALRTPTPPLPAVVFGKLPTRRDRIV